MNEIDKLHKLGQSIWYDNIERKLLRNGEMEKMISLGEIRGVTSNPSIFQNAIANSSDYDEAIQPLAWSDWTAEEIFFQLAIEDIRETCDLFMPLYNQSEGLDGFVSLEVNPKLAYDTEGTIQQAKELWQRVNRKNLMIKIPATLEGLPAIRKSIAAGLNINVTLIFSLERYDQVIDAYLSGLEDRLQQNLPINHIASVASFFVSRVDSKIDSMLDNLIEKAQNNVEKLSSLKGKVAIANSRLAYELFNQRFFSDRIEKLAQGGANMQRPLWASTSTKNPNYHDVLYVEELIGKHTVNTMPPQTLDAFRDHGKAELRISNELAGAHQIFNTLNEIGISIGEVTQILEDEGVIAFEKAFDSLLQSIEQRKAVFQKQIDKLASYTRSMVQQQDQDKIINRIYEKDSTIWTKNKDSFKEIQNRLGWLDAPYEGKQLIEEIVALRDELLNEGFTHAVLLGMGGSSLAAEVISLSFRGVVDGMFLSVLDSTDPRQIISIEEQVPVGKTLFIVSSKSGGTTEVQAMLNYFYQKLEKTYGLQTGKYFIAITDPNTELSQQAKELNFRKVFFANPTVGGRFSALTAFGLVPAGLIGVELETYLQKTIEFARNLRPGVPTGRNPGLVLGTILAEASKIGIDKLTIVAEEPFRSIGSWLEQLIAESSGKDGKGVIPIDIEPIVGIDHYSYDRIFIYLKNDGIFEEIFNELLANGHQVIQFDLNDPYDLGCEFLRWEFAISIACGILGINAFDQPDVQDNKNRTKQKISEFKQTGSFNSGNPVIDNEDLLLYCDHPAYDFSGKSTKEILDNFLSVTQPGDYVAINAYLPRNSHIEKELQDLRKHILVKSNLATTLGFGPRFLHSTGQLHKGGPDKCLILQIVDSPRITLEIPTFGLKFSDLLHAQALGDYEALVQRNRRIIRIHLKSAKIGDLY